MATTTLSFTKQGDEHVATYTSTGDTVVQLARVKGGKLGVYAYIDGMTPKHLHTWYEESQFNLFKVCVPAGMKVDIHSATEVTTGKTLTEETA